MMRRLKVDGSVRTLIPIVAVPFSTTMRIGAIHDGTVRFVEAVGPDEDFCVMTLFKSERSVFNGAPVLMHNNRYYILLDSMEYCLMHVLILILLALLLNCSVAAERCPRWLSTALHNLISITADVLSICVIAPLECISAWCDKSYR